MASSSKGSKPKSNNIALDACDIPCVPVFRKNTNESITKSCDESMLSSARCYTETEAQDQFYNAIKWNLLSDTINTSMGYFVEELNTNIELGALIQKAYKFGPIRDPRGATTKRFGRLGVFVVNNEHLQFCKNLILKLTLTSIGGRIQELSHISLHPKLPFYYRDTRKSRSGCGYYAKGVPAHPSGSGAPRGRSRSRSAERGSSAAAAGRSRSRSTETEAETGPFHYKVDTLYWKDAPFRANQKHIPFMEFHPDPSQPGHFREGVGDFREEIRRHKIVLEKKKPKEAPKVLTTRIKSQAAEQARSEAAAGESSKKREKEIFKQLMSVALESVPEPEAGTDDEGTLSRDMAEQIETLNRIHQTISHEFLRFWNTKLLTGVEAQASRANRVNQYPGFPSILKSAEGGRRRTRKVRR
jgi:hypothetical protein